MTRVSVRSMVRGLAVAACAGASLSCIVSRGADTEEAVTIRVDSVSAKVGEKAVITAVITPRPGFTIAEAYRNRLSSLSSADNGVKLDAESVRATVRDGALVFKLSSTPLSAGPHPINGVFRFAFVSESGGDSHLDIKSAPLVATVSGIE
jgi:hypothetical protein